MIFSVAGCFSDDKPANKYSVSDLDHCRRRCFWIGIRLLMSFFGCTARVRSTVQAEQPGSGFFIRAPRALSASGSSTLLRGS